LLLIAIACGVPIYVTIFLRLVIGIAVGLTPAIPQLGILDDEDLKRSQYYLPGFSSWMAAISMGESLNETKALEAIHRGHRAGCDHCSRMRTRLRLVPYWTAFSLTTFFWAANFRCLPFADA